MTYLACGGTKLTAGTTIQVVPVSGTPTTVFTAPANQAMTDVAPSRDGSYLYVAIATYDTLNPPASQDPVRQTGRVVKRLAKQSSGVYQLDTTWGLGFNGSLIEGRFIATDHAGNLYIASGKDTTNTDNKVLKFAADANGNVLHNAPVATSFGHPAGTSRFVDLMGIAVTGDGSVIYTVEQGGTRPTYLSRFKRQGTAATDSYAFELEWGNNYDGTCNEGILASPYDAGVDLDGNVYVVNTTCGRVEKYRVDTQTTLAVTHLGSMVVKPNTADCPLSSSDICNKPHGLAVDLTGNVYVPQTNVKMVKTGTDTTAPTVPVLQVTESTGNQHVVGTKLFYRPGAVQSGSFNVTATTSDPESGVTQVRFPSVFTTSDGASDTTSPYAQTYPWSGATSVAGTKTVTATNGVGLTSSATFSLQPDTTGPTVQLTAPLAGTTVVAGQELQATASDDGGSGIAKIQFRYCPGTSCQGVASTLIATSTTPVSSNLYTVRWTTLPTTQGSYVLKAVAYDRVGNITHSAVVPVTVDTNPPLFSDDFEAGTLAKWSNSGLAVVSPGADGSTKAARGAPASNFAYARANLSSAQTTVYVRARIKLVSQDPTAGTRLLAVLRSTTTGTASVVHLNVTKGGTLALYNYTTNTPLGTSATAFPKDGAFHTLQLRVTVNGSASSIGVWLDGIPVNALFSTTASLGTTALSQIQIGDQTSAHTWDASFDTVSVGTRCQVETCQASTLVFQDGFETGTLAKWPTPATGSNYALEIQQGGAVLGTYAAKGVSTGTAATTDAAYARTELATAQPELSYAARVKLVATGTGAKNIKLLSVLDTNDTSVFSLYARASDGALVAFYPKQPTGATQYVFSATKLRLGAWQRIELHLAVATTGTTPLVEVWVDGVKVSDLHNTTFSLGTYSLQRLQLGEHLPQAFSWTVLYDDVMAGTSCLGTCPAWTSRSR